MNTVGYIDIESNELKRYFDAVEKKKDICRILPGGRFSILKNGYPRFDGLVCSDRMNGDQTGMGAENCENCKINREFESQK